MRLTHRSTRGDTIIEVLLAIAITSVVLAGAYVAVDRSMRASRSAQERGEAVKVAEAQIERLKYLNFSSTTANIYQNVPFCITPELAVQTITNIESEPNCTTSGRYTASVTRDNSSGTHQITVLWENITGSKTSAAHPGFDEIKMYYRIYQ